MTMPGRLVDSRCARMLYASFSPRARSVAAPNGGILSFLMLSSASVSSFVLSLSSALCSRLAPLLKDTAAARSPGASDAIRSNMSSKKRLAAFRRSSCLSFSLMLLEESSTRTKSEG